MKIDSADQDIRNLLSSGYYKIPRFQRPYAWDRENIQQFWDDVVKDDVAQYFIGSMVVYRLEKDSQRFGVVDGQQRLTTITILLSVLRDKLQQLGFSDFAQGVQNLIERKNIDNKPEFILSTETSYPFFQDHIQNFATPEVVTSSLHEEENLRSARDQFRQFVDDLVSSVLLDSSLTDEKKLESSKKKLLGVRDSLLDLKLILIKLDNEDDAYVIFETLNTRGKDLSLTDLVKNHLTKLLRPKNAQLDHVKIKWTKILETIQGSQLDLDTDVFIHHFWLSRFDYIPAKDVFPQFKKRVDKANAQNILDQLVGDATIYRDIHETTGKWNKQERQIEESLKALSLFKVRQPTPCVLSLVRAYRTEKIKKKKLEEALQAIERFHFLFTAVTSQRSSGGVSGMYASIARRLFDAKDSQDAALIINELQQKLRDRVPSKETVLAAFREVLFTENFTKSRSLVRYILARVHSEFYGAATVDYQQMTIEHLIPQVAMKMDGEEQEEIIGQLGNLILVPQELNSKLGTKKFLDKKAIMFEEQVPMDSILEDSDQWGVDQIEKRTKWIAELAFDKLWKV